MIFAGNYSILPQLRPSMQLYIDFCLNKATKWTRYINQEISQQEDWENQW